MRKMLGEAGFQVALFLLVVSAATLTGIFINHWLGSVVLGAGIIVILSWSKLYDRLFVRRP